MVTRAQNPEEFAPASWFAVRLPLSDSWSAFTHIGYQQLATWYGSGVLRPLDAWPRPSGTITELRDTCVPLGVGLRLTMAQPEPIRTRVFVECGAALSRARLEREFSMRVFWGQPVRSTESADYRLPGVDLRTWLRHPVSDSFGVEWGLRWAIRETPRGAAVERLMGYRHRSSATLSLEAASALSP